MSRDQEPFWIRSQRYELSKLRINRQCQSRLGLTSCPALHVAQRADASAVEAIQVRSTKHFTPRRGNAMRRAVIVSGIQTPGFNRNQYPLLKCLSNRSRATLSRPGSRDKRRRSLIELRQSFHRLKTHSTQTTAERPSKVRSYG